MELIAHHAAPQSLLSAPARIGGAVAALAIIVSSVAFAGHASHSAVSQAHTAMNPAIVYITLPTVEVLARKTVAGADEVACVNPASRI